MEAKKVTGYKNSLVPRLLNECSADFNYKNGLNLALNAKAILLFPASPLNLL